MKHAILILAHKDFIQLRHLIEYFVRDCYVYVHIDKKSLVTADEIQMIKSMPQVRVVYQRYKLHWGGFSILKTEVFMLQEALKDGDFDSIHLISGQDYPIKPLNEFLDFFEKHQGQDFIRYSNLPNSHWDGYTFLRFKYYYPYDYINDSRENIQKKVSKTVLWQKRLGIHRRIPDHFDRLYGSTQWFSLTKSTVETILRYTRKHPALYRRSRWTFAPEEFYFATLVANLIPKVRIVPTDLRFIRWKKENGNYPANLCMSHFVRLAERNPFFFARKIEAEKGGDALVRAIDRYLLTENKLEILDNGGWQTDSLRLYDCSAVMAENLSRLCHSLDIKSVLDIGCGPGYYVANLRSRGLAVTGYDANPHTEELSSLFLPSNDEKCGVADITEDVDVDEPFDMTICVQLLSCIPHQTLQKAIANIAKITDRYILISEKEDVNNKRMSNNVQEYALMFRQHGFKPCPIAIAYFHHEKVKDSFKSIILEKDISVNHLKIIS